MGPSNPLRNSRASPCRRRRPLFRQGRACYRSHSLGWCRVLLLRGHYLLARTMTIRARLIWQETEPYSVSVDEVYAVHALAMFCLWVGVPSRPSARACAYQLLRLMSDLSEDCYAAGWLIGCEVTLWDFVTRNQPGDWGGGFVAQEDINSLRRLSAACGGWWHWPDGADDKQFVTLEEWTELYANQCGAYGVEL